MFKVIIKNVSTQATQAGEFYIRNIAKDFIAKPVCQGGGTNYGEETIEIPVLQPNQTWQAADKRIMDIQTFKNDNCSCTINQCGGGTMRFTLLTKFKQPYLGTQTDFEVKWDKSGEIPKNVVADLSIEASK